MNNCLKRIIALLLAVLLCFSCAALAETTETAETTATTETTEAAETAEESVFVEINWTDFEAAIAKAEINADFVTFDEIAAKIWMPAVFQPVELTEEDRNNGIIGFYTYDPENAESGVLVMLVPSEFEDVVDYAEFVLKQGGTDFEFAILNGIPALSYSLPDKDVLYVAMISTDKDVLEFAFWPASDEGMLSVYQIMIASIQAQ